jgi:hypothetical protein
MRTASTVLSSIAALAAMSALAFAAPSGMAPYPGQVSPYAAPPPPSPGMAPSPYGAGAAAPPAAKPLKPAGCVWSRQIRDWSPVNDETMIVRQGSKRFLVTFNGRCRDSRYEYAMGVDTRYSSCLRAGDRVTFRSPFGYAPGRMNFPCTIKKVEELPQSAQR